MDFIGNDIISLFSSDNIKSHSSSLYLSKAFTKKELDYIYSSEIGKLSYLIWTCKEAAYKITQKKGNVFSFSPGLFNVTITQSNKSKIFTLINYENDQFYAESSITTNFIHTIAFMQPGQLNEIRTHVECNTNISYRNNYVIEMLIKYINKDFNIPEHEIVVLKDIHNIPRVIAKQTFGRLNVSVSHDGNFLAIALFKGY